MVKIPTFLKIDSINFIQFVKFRLILYTYFGFQFEQKMKQKKKKLKGEKRFGSMYWINAS